MRQLDKWTEPLEDAGVEKGRLCRESGRFVGSTVLSSNHFDLALSLLK